MRARQCGTRGAWLVLLMGACGACAATRSPHDAWTGEGEARAIGVGQAPPAPPPGSDGRAGLGFVLESTLRARRIRNGRPTMFLELSNGAAVVDGDRLQVTIRTSQDVYLYLAFCSQNARDPQYPGLKVFPEQGAIRARAYEPTIAPDRAAEIVLDRQPGQEALYLILSRTELSSADSGLAQVLAAARQGNQSADCGTPFRSAIAGARGARKQGTPNAVWSGKLRSREGRRAAAGPPQQLHAGAEQDPVVEIQRGGDIVWNNGLSMGVDADPDGIVILRYGLTHVAAP